MRCNGMKQIEGLELVRLTHNAAELKQIESALDVLRKNGSSFNSWLSRSAP